MLETTLLKNTNKNTDRFSIPSTRTTDSRTRKYRLGKSVLEVQTFEDASLYCDWNSSGLDDVTTSALFTMLYGIMEDILLNNIN